MRVSVSEWKYCLKIVLTGLSLAFLVAANQPSCAAEKQLRAGAALSNITPPLGELIVGGWKPIPAEHVHDELHARCLVLDDGTTQLAFVICDNVGIPREVFDLAKQHAHEATGIPQAQMMLASTHTHSATTARGPSKVIWQDELTDYQKFLARRISDGIRRAYNQLEPARIAWGKAEESSEVFNRRWYVSDTKLLGNPFGGRDRVRMNPPRGNAALERPAGPIDPEVCFLAVQSVHGRPIALLANYSLHYVGGVRKGDISADYFGYFAKFLTEKLGAQDQEPPFVAMMSNGTSGDINNINFQPGKTKRKRYAPYEKMQEVAEKLSQRVAEVHRTIQFRDWVELGAEQIELPLEVRKPDRDMLKHFAALKNESARQPSHSRETIYAERIARLKEAPGQIDIPLQTFRIGELGICAIPFETFVEIGLDLKHRSPFRQTFTIELANGSYGYLPTPEQHQLGGYETWLGTSFVEYKASEKIVTQSLTMLKSLRGNVDSKGAQLKLQETDESLVVFAKDIPIVCYNKKSPPLPSGIDPIYHRSGFLHPISTPKGRVVTGAFPADHPHQDGLFSAWVNTSYRDRDVDFWNLKAGKGRVLHERVVSVFETADKAGFEVDLLHRIESKPKLDVLRERWKITVYQTEGNYHCFDLETTQTALTDTPLVINEYHYGGIALRGPAEWLLPKDDATADLQKTSRFLNDLRSGRVKGNHQHARWVALAGQLDSAPAVIAVLSHPDNFRAPQAARLHPRKPYFCFAPCVDGSFEIGPGKPFQSRYRILVQDQQPDADWLTAEWEAWTKGK